ncbi:TPA: P-loop NTPase fold protein [Mannheimia haemolytica]
MNTHITEYLDLYLQRENTQYATLLIGNWGCGKTYFIKDYINQKERNDKDIYKFIYISLFGLKSISSVNSAIFESLHPLLSSKPVKFLGGVLQHAVKVGFRVDIFGGEKDKESTINVDFSKINPLENRDYKELVFVFDDLERTGIPLPEILGFINLLCEQSNSKVIVISNEKEIIEDKTYNKFKEKLVGKTLIVKNNEKDFWIRYKNKHHAIITDGRLDVIKEVFKKFGDGNFRVLEKTTEDYLDFIRGVSSNFLENSSFDNWLIKDFFSFSLKFRQLNNFDYVITYMEKENYYKHTMFDNKEWEDIITGFYQNYERLNEKISTFPIFKIEENASWKNLWRYLALTNNEFQENMEDMLKRFKNYEYNDIGVLVHVINLIVLFINKKICNIIDIDEIKQIVGEYIAKNMDNPAWADSMIVRFNGTGLGYVNENDPDVKEIVGQIYNGIDKIKQHQKIVKARDYFDQALESIITGDWRSLSRFSEWFENTTFLGEVDVSKYRNILANGFYAYNFCDYLEYRYDKKQYDFFKKERVFLNEIKIYIGNNLNSTEFDDFEKMKFREAIKIVDEIYSKNEKKSKDRL